MLNKRFGYIRQLTHLNDNYTHGNVVVLADGLSPCLFNAMGPRGAYTDSSKRKNNERLGISKKIDSIFRKDR